MKLEVEVDPKSMATYVSEQESAGQDAVSESPGRRRAKSALPHPPPKCVDINSHHYDTFSPREGEGSPAAPNFDSDMGDALGSPRARAKTDAQREVFTKTKDWNERDGVLRIVKISDAPSNVYQPKFTMKVQVKI